MNSRLRRPRLSLSQKQKMKMGTKILIGTAATSFLALIIGIVVLSNMGTPSITKAAGGVTRYWRNGVLYKNIFNNNPDRNRWAITDDNGTGSWSASSSGATQILHMDNAAGGYANKLLNMNGTASSGSIIYNTLDKVNGKIDIRVVGLSNGQQFYVKADQYTSANAFLSTVTVLNNTSATGVYTVAFSSITWAATAT